MPVPVAAPVLHLLLAHGDVGDDLGDLRVQVGDVDVRLDVVDGPPDVGGEQVEDAAAPSGVKRRMRRSRVEDDDGDLDAVEQVDEVAVDRGSARWLRLCSSSLTVVSSSLVDCSSSLAVSSSSFMLCSSSLPETSSSLAEPSSSLVRPCSSSSDWRYSFVAVQLALQLAATLAPRHASLGRPSAASPRGARLRVRRRTPRTAPRRAAPASRAAGERDDHDVAARASPSPPTSSRRSRTGAFCFRACASAVRSGESSPSRAILSRLCCGCPAAGSR